MKQVPSCLTTRFLFFLLENFLLEEHSFIREVGSLADPEKLLLEEHSFIREVESLADPDSTKKYSTIVFDHNGSFSHSFRENTALLTREKAKKIRTTIHDSTGLPRRYIRGSRNPQVEGSKRPKTELLKRKGARN